MLVHVGFSVRWFGFGFNWIGALISTNLGSVVALLLVATQESPVGSVVSQEYEYTPSSWIFKDSMELMPESDGLE